ncbi:MAG TPA: UvrD-helicase domain-containing protein [Trueperaceae bacterium]|nr:UvrD-helicase domain-containing protein [Trueperaceae bacterium]
MTRAGEGLLPAQAGAATHPGSVAVVAGAGTGKTHMLAHRYLHHLETGLEPLDIVAVTFTERAAAELRARIRELVRTALAHRPEVAVALEAAQISTVHALAARICRDHPEAAGVPPDFSVLDDLEGQVWLAERLDEALAELPGEVFAELAYADVRAALRALLGDPIEAEAAFSHGPESWGERVAAVRRQALAELTGAPAWRQAAALARDLRGQDGDRLEAARASAAAGLEQLTDGEVGAGLAALAAIDLRGGRKGAWPDGELARVKAALRTLREATRAALEEGVVDLTLGPADDRLAALLPQLASAFEAVRDALAAEKRRRRVLDFADLEVHALRALQDADVRAHYADRWKAALVDEFQDTNPVQERLLELLTAGMTVTVVGDEKQSIYGFRGADVRVFRRARERMRADPGAAEVAMDRSFRAHAALTAVVNRISAAVLGPLHQDLVAERGEAPHPGPHVGVRLLAGSGNRARRQVGEARLIAAAIKALLDAGTPVWDRAEGRLRAVRPEDVAVLTRTWQPLGIYGEILPALGVPAVHSGGGNLLDTREAKDGLAMLRFLADPRDDVALAAVLRGPFFAVDDPSLYRFAGTLPRIGGDGAAAGGRRHAGWWEALDGMAPPPEALAAPRRSLRELLASRDWPAVRRLQLADDLTGYSAVLAALPGAPRRLADWTGFLDLVRSLQRGLGDAFGVWRRLRRLLRAEVAVPRPTLQAEGAVDLLTIHRAKGLEWPVVVVADLDRGGRSDAPPMLFRGDAGVAFRLQGEDGERVLPAMYRVLRADARRREEEESRRVLYVALTRARDRLLLTAAGERRGALDVLLPALEAAGAEVRVVEQGEGDGSYPPPPAAVAGDVTREPLLWSDVERERLGAALAARRPGAAAAAAGGWEAVERLVAGVDEAWLPLVRGLRAAGAPPPPASLVDAELTRADEASDLRMVLGWPTAEGIVAVVDAATPEGAAFDARTLRIDPSAPPGRAVEEVLAALA